MRKALLLIATLAAPLCAMAQVNCQTGQLSQLVTDTTITTLTLTGQMDVRDFKFIAQKLPALVTVDLSGVEIVAYEDLANTTIGNEHSFAAGEVPTLSLAGKQALTSVVLPATTTSLGQAALAACPRLTSVDLGDNLTAIGDYALSGCTSLASVTVPGTIASVGKGAFSRCSALRQFTVTSSGTAASLVVGDEAFLDCGNLTDVDLGDNVTSIGSLAFAGTGITVVDLSTYKRLTTLGNYVYALSPVQSATFVSSLSSMGLGTFIYNDRLTTMTLPSSVDELPAFTLAGNTALTTVDLGNVKSVGDYALYSASSVQEVTVPERVTFIGTRAMAGMTALTMITSEAATAPSLGDEVWLGVDQPDVRLSVKTSSFDSYGNAEQWKEFLLGSNLLLGDVDEDGHITVQDMDLMINILLKILTEYPVQTDTDEDDDITINDVNYVLNSILKRIPESYIFITPNTISSLTINNFSIAPGETLDVDVMLDNDEMVSQLQCDIELPQGLSLVGVNTASRTQNHTLVSDLTEGNLRLVCYSLTDDDLPGNEGAVFTLRVCASEDLAAESTITINNVVLAGKGHDALFAAETTATVSNVSGVEDVTATARVYANGNTIVIEAPEACTAQLVAMNGTSGTIQVEAGRNEYHPGTGIYVVRLAGKGYKVVVR